MTDAFGRSYSTRQTSGGVDIYDLTGGGTGGGTGGVTVVAESGTGSSSNANVSVVLSLTSGTWLIRGDYTYHESSVGSGSLTIDGTIVHTAGTGPGDSQGTSQAVLFGLRTITLSESRDVTLVGVASSGYINTGLLLAMAWKIG